MVPGIVPDIVPGTDKKELEGKRSNDLIMK